MTFQEIIEYCLNFDNDLELAYDYLQELYKIAKLSNYENARENIIEWCQRIESDNRKLPEFKKVALTYRSWIYEICNSFIINQTTNARITNGFIEGKNNFCKVIKRIGFGFKNFDTFRAKVLYANDEDRPYRS
jgi:transposase